MNRRKLRRTPKITDDRFLMAESRPLFFISKAVRLRWYLFAKSRAQKKALLMQVLTQKTLPTRSKWEVKVERSLRLRKKNK